MKSENELSYVSVLSLEVRKWSVFNITYVQNILIEVIIFKLSMKTIDLTFT